MSRAYLCILALKKVMNKIKYMNAKVKFLQETHTLNNENIKIKRRWQGSVFAG